MKYHCVLYWYTTRLRRGVFEVKAGSARRKASSPEEAAEIRIKEQMTAKDSSDPHTTLHVEDVSDECETGDEHESLSRLRQLEQNWLHAKQKRMGMWVPSESKKSEWFFDLKKESVDNVVEIGKSLVNEWRHGVARPNAYLMREEQQACHDMAVAHFNNGGKQFLMNAKMRFGKTFTSYEISKTLQLKRVLVITYKPAVDTTWREDLDNHIDFDGCTYYSAKDYSSRNPIQLSGTSKGTEVLFSSFQDFNDFNKAKWQHAKKYHYDMILIDEMHYGAGTDLAKASLAQLDYDRILYVSGTPLKALMSGQFLDDEIYTWGYADEQAKRREEELGGWETEIYRWLPVMKFHTFEVVEDAKKLVELYFSEEGFSMTKMFGSEDGKTFVDQSAVKLFVDQVFGRGVKKNNSPVRTHAVDHMLWMLPPNVKSVTALCALLTATVGDEYYIINVAGDNVADLDVVKQKILEHPKTITVSCGRFNTGVTVPEWDMVMMLDDTRSPESYFQTVFRCQSPDQRRGKELCTVVDFNPQRCLEMIYEYADVTAKKGTSTQQAVREFLEFAPVLDHKDNTTVEIDVDLVLDIMAQTGGYAERFGSSIMFNMDIIEHYADMFVGIDATASANISESNISDNGLEKGNNFRPSDRLKHQAEKRQDEKEHRELVQRVVSVMRKLPTYLYLEDEKIDNVHDLLYTNNTDLFYKSVGITLDNFKELCGGFIRTDRLDRAIMAFNQAGSRLE
jgi:superfamily II DNA or RNA helicase